MTVPAEPETRDYLVQDRFDLALEKTMTFPLPGSQLTEIELPLGCRVVSAEMEVEGQEHIVAGGMTRLEYTDTTNNQAWYGEFASPSGNSPSTLKVNLFSNAQYNQVHPKDTVFAKFVPNQDGNKPYTLHRFRMNETDYEYFEPYMKGAFYEPFSATMNAWHFTYFLIWNNTKTGWDTVGYNEFQSNTVSTQRDISHQFTSGFDHYVDTADDIYLLITCNETVSATSYQLDVDYVGINVSVPPVDGYPAEVGVDVGDDGDNDFYQFEELNTSVVFNDSKFADELQDYIDAAVTDPVTIPINVTVGLGGKVRLHGLTVNYFTNTEPTQDTDIPDSAFDEDGDGVGLINITTYFSDDNQDIYFVNIEQRGGTTIMASQSDDDYMMDFSAPANFYGREEFRIKVFDDGIDDVPDTIDDLFIYSNWFNVTVNPTDDAPVLEKVDGTTVATDIIELDAYEDMPFTVDMEASDIDGDDVEFMTNNTLFMIEAGADAFNVTPTQDDVGVIWVNLTAKEVNASVLEDDLMFDHVTLKITVHPTNDMPFITSFKPVGKSAITYTPDATVLTCLEDEQANWTTLFDDPDGDDVTFSCNFTNDRFTFSPTGEFGFFPLQEDVGDHQLNVTVEDAAEESYAEIIIRVNNVNDAPVLGDLSYSGGVEELTVTLSTTDASDEDGDELTYSWDFEVGDAKEGQSIEHEFLEAGIHNVTLTVTDGKGGSAVGYILVNVTEPVIPDNNGTDGGTTDGNDTGNGTGGGGGTNGTDGGSGGGSSGGSGLEAAGLWWIIPLIVLALLVVIALVVVVILVMKKKGGDEPALEAPAPVPEEPTPAEQPVQQDPAMQPVEQPMYQDPSQPVEQPMYQDPAAQPEQPMYQDPSMQPVEQPQMEPYQDPMAQPVPEATPPMEQMTEPEPVAQLEPMEPAPAQQNGLDMLTDPNQ